MSRRPACMMSICCCVMQSRETLDRVMARYSDAAEGGISMNWDYLRTQGNFRYDNYSRFLLMFVVIFVLLIMLGPSA